MDPAGELPGYEDERVPSVGAMLCNFIVPEDHATASTDTLTPCAKLAGINAHERDAHLRFQSDGHKYYWKSELVGCSVSCLHILAILVNALLTP